MALIKEITLNSGVITNYHRVVSINNITNVATIIETASYTSSEKREEEKNAIENGVGMDVFIDTNYIPLPYNKSLDVDGAYMHLKTLPKFQNAIDDE